MESIASLRELEEAELGCALRTRDASLALLTEADNGSGISGIGPPDLCTVDKTSSSSSTLSYLTPQPTTTCCCFHYVLGLRVEGAASFAAYFARLTRSQEQASFLGSLVQTQTWKFTGGTYCCYDIFSGCDVRCRVKIPGGVTVSAVTGSGQEVPVDDDIWKGAMVSSFIRTTMLHPNLLLGLEVPNLAVLKSHERFPCSLQDEALLLDSVMHIVRTGRIKQVRERLHYDGAKGCRSEHVDIVSLALMNHFTHVQRVSVLKNVFHQMATDLDDPIQAIYEASCMRYLGKRQEALQYLEYTISLVLQDLSDEEGYKEVYSPLYTAVAELCVDLDDPSDGTNLEFGLEAATKAVSLDADYRPARVVLARLRAISCFNSPSSMAGFREALLALNQIHPPQDIEETEDILIIIPQWSRVVEPSDGSGNIDTKMMSKLKQELEEYGRAKLMELPGNLLVPHKMLLTHDYYLYNFAAAVRREVYLVLVELVAELDWDPFLQLRAQTFFMEEVDSGNDESEEENTEGESDEEPTSEQGGDAKAAGAVCIDVEAGEEGDAAEGREEEVAPKEVAVEIHDDGEAADRGDSGGDEEEVDQGPDPEAQAQIEEGVKLMSVGVKLSESPEPKLKASKFAKEVCNIWLDEIIYALYSDLAEYVEFKLHVKNIKKVIDNDFEVSDYDTELHEGEDEEDPDTDEEVTAVSMFTGQNIAVDWYRRGILAERIFRPVEAERSHRAALNSQFKLVSCVTLLRMYAESQQLKDACEMASKALRELHPGLVNDPAKQVEIPYAIQDAFFHMISRSGLQAVRRAQQQLGGKCPAAISEIFHQAVEWHIAGFAH
ncbi:Chs5p-Arf1p-binding protein [Chloropicon primus]|uniref:Uncharacterized protein n=1 Tax=Chloropicon primus TaxID=1764295 RepID=A0A5B8MQ93_9CHLO|nr:hypothetical protein A3770_06p42930 [Chloropicon primus]UPR00996.1 Chs5p-Arf1p-binding protein [Chloropicon primus]|eukprot:QDZ21775.1 hypothetical protein A3770_06p42930 [Chloropicon primus]